MGTAKVVMAGPGPAFYIRGTHESSADPGQVVPEVWQSERMPTVLNIEVEGRHPEADGFLVEGVMQVTFSGVLLRDLRDGIRIHRRARNVLISSCHVYNNRGIGIFLDRVNLHQIIVTGSHISYCKRGGIRIAGSQIRNLQVTGNDIEYNYDPEAGCSADVWIDSSDPAATVREGTIVGNTIQAMYSPGGANVYMVGHGPEVNHKAGMFTISNNLIGTQEVNVRLVACRGVVLSGNVMYSGRNRNVLVEDSRNVVVSGNSFDHNLDYQPDELCTGLRFVRSEDCIVSGSMVQDLRTDPVDGALREGLVEVEGCQRVSLNGCQVLNGYPAGLFVVDSSDVTVTGCILMDTRVEEQMVVAVCWRGKGKGNLLASNRIGMGTRAALEIGSEAGVRVGDNAM